MTDGSLTGLPTLEWRRVLRRVRVSTATKAVGWALADYTDSDGTNAFPGVKRLGEDTELSRRSVLAGLVKLRDLGLIERVTEGSKGGRPGFADVYRLTVPDDLAERVEMWPVDRDSSKGGAPGAPATGPDQVHVTTDQVQLTHDQVQLTHDQVHEVHTTLPLTLPLTSKHKNTRARGNRNPKPKPATKTTGPPCDHGFPGCASCPDCRRGGTDSEGVTCHCATADVGAVS